MHLAHKRDLELAAVIVNRSGGCFAAFKRLVAVAVLLVSGTGSAMASGGIFHEMTLEGLLPCKDKVCLSTFDIAANRAYAGEFLLWSLGLGEAMALLDRFNLLLDRYAAAGLPEPVIQKTPRGRFIVQVGYAPKRKTNGAYSRQMPKNESLLLLNLAAYRKDSVAAISTMSHEIFHAIQYHYEGMDVVMGGPRQALGGAFRRQLHHWMAEGMADAAAAIATEGMAGYSADPRKSHRSHEDYATKILGMRTYSQPLTLNPPAAYPAQYGNSQYDSFTLATYYSSSFWRYVMEELGGLSSVGQLMLGKPATESPTGVVNWAHYNILNAKRAGRPRFPGGLPQAFAEFISAFADAPFSGRYGDFSQRIAGAPDVFGDGGWQSFVFARTDGQPACPVVALSQANPVQVVRVRIEAFSAACFRVAVHGPGAVAPSFDINLIAVTAAEQDYVCKAITVGSNGVTIKAPPQRPLTGSASRCKGRAQVLYAPRRNMTHQNVVLANALSFPGSGAVSATQQVFIQVEFMLGSATASGHMAPSQQSSSAPPPPPAPGAPSARPASISTGKNVSIKSTSARARGRQGQHATARQKSDCNQSPDFCPQIEIDLAQYDERFEAIAAIGDSLGAGALVALDGAQRQIDVIGTYGNPERLGAMAMEMAGTEFTEVGLRLRAPEGRIEKGMRWDDAVITALVGTMASDENVDMSSHGPVPTPGACGSEPPATGIVQITDVGEGWISGTFSADLFERYVHEPGKDRCATRPANGNVSGTFTAPYLDITQPPVDPELAAYQVWAGLPAIVWTVTDYDDLVREAVATQRDLLRHWESGRGSSDGGGVDAPSSSTCSQQCVPGVLGCPDISPEEVERLTSLYLETLPAMVREAMRQQLQKASPEMASRMLAIGMDVKGCMDTTARP